MAPAQTMAPAQREIEECVIFEIIMSIINNFCRNYIISYPKINLKLSNYLDKCLKICDPSLYQHLTLLELSAAEWGWEPLCLGLATPLLGPENWLKVLDLGVSNVYNHSNITFYYPSVICALLITLRSKIFQIWSKHEFQSFLNDKRNQDKDINMSVLFKLIERILKKFPGGDEGSENKGGDGDGGADAYYPIPHLNPGERYPPIQV